MKTILKSTLFVLLFLAVAAMPHAAALAKTREVAIKFDLLDYGGVAEGVFSASGAVDDEGSARQTYEFATDTLIVGTKYLYGQKGTIVIRFKAFLQPDGSALGHFQIIKGTDAYRWLKGYGETHAWIEVIDEQVHLLGTYTGQVYHIDPK